jgi:hypothetical protein
MVVPADVMEQVRQVKAMLAGLYFLSLGGVVQVPSD